MISVHEMRGRMAIIFVSCFCASMVATRAADSPKSADEAYLNALQGTWLMEGTLRGKPVRYVADGQRVLQDGFVRFHMIDADSKPPYEADVFIGFDPKANDYIAHWLDRFGAAGARVVARGERRGQQLVLIFPYAEGAFRDTFTWHPESGSWSLLLESQGGDKTWSTFADYRLIRTRDR
jgi:hypothetical protein